MRVFWAALAISVAIGLAGLVSLVAAMSEYNSTLETYTELSIRYEIGSFTWVESDFSAAQTRMVITNDSPADATVKNVNVFLQFDGEFAGTNYDRFPSIEVPTGETRVVTLDLLITAPSIQPEGGTANLTFTGSASVNFDGVERDLNLNIREKIGVVPAEGS